jgi:hypothetical protein
MLRLSEEDLWHDLPAALAQLPTFSQPVLQQLDMYALAASAAGVSLLAWAQPAQAKIVYTPAHIPIIQNGGPVELDLNHDGINDFLLTWVYTTEKRRGPEGFWQSSMSVVPVQQSNRVRISKSKGYSAAAALAKGQNVGERSPFEPGNSAMNMQACVGGTSGGCGGPWLKVKQAYLGLKFVIHGETHFGWAHIRKTGVGITGPTLVGYAYETVPNRRIITGTTKGPDDASVEESNATLTTPPREPATLGLLAMGAGGLSIWRREESRAQ